MSGKLYGIGVGPGDPELLTLKAVRIMKESDIIAVPGEDAAASVAYKIVQPVCPWINEKEVIAVPMPMTKDRAQLEKNHDAAAEKIEGYLKAGKQVVFLTLGDVTVYSTYLYVHKRITARGYDTEIINGIPSFCASAARLNIGLVEEDEQMHIIPASYQIDEALKLSGTKILMKAGKKIGHVKQQLSKLDVDVQMIENCGMSNEKIYSKVDDIPEDAGYYSLFIVKEKRK